jgi:hypothetical protein
VRADDRHAVMLRPRMASRRLSRAVAGTERVVIVRSRVSSGDIREHWRMPGLTRVAGVDSRPGSEASKRR